MREGMKVLISCIYFADIFHFRGVFPSSVDGTHTIQVKHMHASSGWLYIAVSQKFKPTRFFLRCWYDCE